MTTLYIDIHTHSRKPGSVCIVSYGLGRDNMLTAPTKPFSCGIHPWDAAGISETEFNDSLQYLATVPLDAVGEAGLDYIHGGDHKKQQEILVAQLEIAKLRDLPVIIHCVKAYNDLFAIVKRYPRVNFILHGYTGSPEQTRQAIDLGCYFSIGETSLNSLKTIESIKEIPLERIFAETDESAVTIDGIYKNIALIKDFEITDLANIIQDNFNNLFRTANER